MPKRKSPKRESPDRETEAKPDGSATYEELLRRLEETVERLEDGGLSLDEAMSAYEEGVRLATQCQKLMDTAEQRIQELQEAEEA